MKLILVRHGQTDWNVNKIIQGRVSVSLNETGVEQVKKTSELLLEELDGERVAACYYSPLVRTTESAKIMSSIISTEYIPDGRLEERGFGSLVGKPEEDYTDDLDLYWDDDLNYSNYQVEPVRSFRKRVMSFLDDIKKNHDDNDIIIIISHGSTLTMFYRLLGKQIKEYEVCNASFAVFDY